MSEGMFGWKSEIETCECGNELGYIIKNIPYFYIRVGYSKIGYVTVDRYVTVDMSQWMNKWSEWVKNAWMDEWMRECVNEWMSNWICHKEYVIFSYKIWIKYNWRCHSIYVTVNCCVKQ